MALRTWTWNASDLGKLIGVVTSGARASIVPIRISREAIEEVHDEMLVVIDDFVEGRRFLGAIKSAMKLDIAVDGNALPTTFDPAKSKHYSAPMMKTYVEIFGEITPDGYIELSFAIPRPGSYVYMVTNGEGLAKILRLPKGLVVGYHKFSGMEIHLDPAALDYHIAVLGATGTGKSRLVKGLVEEIVAKTRYSVVIFDHTGVDYADPNRWSFDIEIVDASRIVLDLPVVASILIEKANIPSSLEEHVTYAVARYVMDQVARLADDSLLTKFGLEVLRNSGRGYNPSRILGELDIDSLNKAYIELCSQEHEIWSYDTFMNSLPKYLDEIGARDTTKLKVKMLISIYAGRSFFENYLSNRNVALDSIVEDLFNGRKVVIFDLSTESEAIAKRHVVYQVLRKIWDRIALTRSRANVIAVIDEAHNYACYHGCRPSNQEIERTAREGRKWGFGIILASQRIIDLAPDIRGNINTVFFSRLQTHGDYQELRNWIEGVQNMEYTLPLLARREFFVAGLANPFRKPVLLRVRDVV